LQRAEQVHQSRKVKNDEIAPGALAPPLCGHS
jgi:hypothetical protein